MERSDTTVTVSMTLPHVGKPCTREVVTDGLVFQLAS
jgi:hypothetical protein